ncbi:hypothetical protein GW17_00038998 [Ensete ventricosum]|nr:hypothetical protein GW17_00038998 [Ensete ventricosum]
MSSCAFSGGCRFLLLLSPSPPLLSIAGTRSLVVIWIGGAAPVSDSHDGERRSFPEDPRSRWLRDLFSTTPNPSPCSFSGSAKRLRLGDAIPAAVVAEEDQHNLVDSLSEEILFLILDRLDSEPLDKKSFSFVCRSFYAAESRHRRALTPLRSDLLPAALAHYALSSRLDLSLCPRITDATLASVNGALRSSLRSIDLSRSRGFSQAGVGNLAVNCAALVEINLSNATDLSDAAAAAIGRARNLERLWLARCKVMVDMGIGCIAVGCQKLRLLCLKWCLGISDLGFGLVAVKCKRLRCLDFSFMPIINLAYCTGTTDDSLRSLSKCSNLDTLEIRGCPQVSSLGLAAISVGCQKLTNLGIKKCYYVNDAGILLSCLLLQNLRQINLSYCSVTDVGLLALASVSCL